MNYRSIFFIAFSVLLLFSCSVNKSNKEEFEKYFKVNVSACASVFVQQNKMDSLSAINYCSCMLTKLHDLDSNLVRFKGKELTEMINKYKDSISIDCDTFLLKSNFPMNGLYH